MLCNLSSLRDYKEYHTDTTVKYLITMTPEELAKAEQEGLHKKFKLQTSMKTTNMVRFGFLSMKNKYLQILKHHTPLLLLQTKVANVYFRRNVYIYLIFNHVFCFGVNLE